MSRSNLCIYKNLRGERGDDKEGADKKRRQTALLKEIQVPRKSSVSTDSGVVNLNGNVTTLKYYTKINLCL